MSDQNPKLAYTKGAHQATLNATYPNMHMDHCVWIPSPKKNALYDDDPVTSRLNPYGLWVNGKPASLEQKEKATQEYDAKNQHKLYVCMELPHLQNSHVFKLRAYINGQCVSKADETAPTKEKETRPNLAQEATERRQALLLPYDLPGHRANLAMLACRFVDDLAKRIDDVVDEIVIQYQNPLDSDGLSASRVSYDTAMFVSDCLRKLSATNGLPVQGGDQIGQKAQRNAGLPVPRVTCALHPSLFA